MEMMIQPDLLARAERIGSDEELIAYLRESGLPKSVSVIAFAHARGVPFVEAKQAVHRSRVWSGSRDLDEAVRDTLLSDSRH